MDGLGLDAQALDYLERMMSAAGRMKVLISDLLEYSRISTRGLPYVECNLQEVAHEVIGDLEALISSSNATVLVNELPTTIADPTQMRQLIQNLVANAIKFRAPERASVVRIHGAAVAAPQRGGKAGTKCVRIVVEDNGIGFDSRFSERIFAPFMRLHGRGEFEGSGIGLAIVRRIVDRHGGLIQAFGEPGVGARFVIELPVAGPAQSQKEA